MEKRMPGMINHEKAFVKLFSQTARYHHRFKVFGDFISCSVIALENRLHFSEVREQKYLRIVGGYEKEDVTRMARLLAGWVTRPGTSWGASSCSWSWVINTGAVFHALWAHVNCYVFLNLVISMGYTDDFN